MLHKNPAKSSPAGKTLGRFIMAKINHTIADYKETLAGFKELRKVDYLPIPVIKRFVRVFTEIEDPRCQGMTDYPLGEILLAVFLAVLANASAWTYIEQFGQKKLHYRKDDELYMANLY